MLKRAWNVWKRDFRFDVFSQRSCRIYHLHFCWCYSVASFHHWEHTDCFYSRDFYIFMRICTRCSVKYARAADLKELSNLSNSPLSKRRNKRFTFSNQAMTETCMWVFFHHWPYRIPNLYGGYNSCSSLLSSEWEENCINLTAKGRG